MDRIIKLKQVTKTNLNGGVNLTNPIFSIKQAQAADAFTMNQIGIPSAVLMERAALAVADALFDHYDLTKALVVAATGNNGGDGLAVTRLLKVKGIDVAVLRLGNPANATDETKRQQKICTYYQIPFLTSVSDFSVYTTLVDAIFGVGLARPVEGHFADVITQMNTAPANIMAIDVPSGIDADSGEVKGTAIQATETVTMAANKLGFTKPQSQPYTGKVTVADIGVYAHE